MATIILLVDGQVATVAPVNANFAALNTEIAGASRTGYSSGTEIGNILTGVDTLHAYPMPAGTISAVGDGLLVRAIATFAGNANTKAMTFAIGTGGPHTLNGAVPAPNGLSCSIDIYVIYLGGNSWAVSSRVFYDNETLDINSAAVQTGQNPAAALTIKFSGSATLTNDITMQAATFTVFKAA